MYSHNVCNIKQIVLMSCLINFVFLNYFEMYSGVETYFSLAKTEHIISDGNLHKYIDTNLSNTIWF